MKARDNPLRVDCLERLRHRPVGWTWEQLDTRLRELSFRGAVVGPKGSGKTTLLNDLEHHLSAAGHRVARLMLRDEVRSVPAWFVRHCLPDRVILLDGAEQLCAPDWRAFLQMTAASRGLIVTSHHHGLLPTLVECRTTPELLEQLLNDLLTTDLRLRLGGLPLRSWRNRGGNLHDVWRELYHCLAEKQIFCPLSD